MALADNNMAPAEAIAAMIVHAEQFHTMLEAAIADHASTHGLE